LKFAFICVYLRPLLRGWRYHRYLESVTLAGSHAKGTDLKDSDFDIFLRLSPDAPGPLSATQTSLADHLHGHIRNVAVRILFEGRFVDLVPARRSSTSHILWQARFNTWLKTDIEKQIRYVRSSGFIDEILALKIWRRRHALRFPSFLMELATIHALSQKVGDCPPISKNQSRPNRNSAPKSAGYGQNGDCPPISKNEPCMNRNSTPKSAGFGQHGDCLPISKNEHCMNRNSAPKSAGCPLGISQSFPALLHFLATAFPTTRLLDPANSNNVVSDLLTEVERLRIARRASLSLRGGL